ncbi:hypothetical protein [Paludisphaera soli]|uniref:hypothetical protein n=1 Tax=Paludisphaera soli TaxID=2712865 RepID=UPI0013EBA654|nr:hypothetical protein [Paludisphaera soli]
MSRLARMIASSILLASMTAGFARAEIMMTPREGMNATSLLQSASMTLRILNETTPFSTQDVIEFTGSYTDTSATLSLSGLVGGQQLALDLSTVLVGDIGEDITVSIAGGGSWGLEPISTNGQTFWVYDAGISDYQEMQYADQGTFGTGSRSWVVRGAELVIGAGVGGWIAGWAGAFTGALAAWTISDIVYEVVDSLTPPPPPPTPPTPPTPPAPVYPPPVPNNGIIDIINGSGNTVYKNNGGKIQGTGAFNGGNLTGQFVAVSEPSSVILLAVAGAFGVGYQVSRRRPTRRAS